MSALDWVSLVFMLKLSLVSFVVFKHFEQPPKENKILKHTNRGKYER